MKRCVQRPEHECFWYCFMPFNIYEVISSVPPCADPELFARVWGWMVTSMQGPNDKVLTIPFLLGFNQPRAHNNFLSNIQKLLLDGSIPEFLRKHIGFVISQWVWTPSGSAHVSVIITTLLLDKPLCH